MGFYTLNVGDPNDPKFRWLHGDFSGNIPRILMELGSVGGVRECVAAMRLLESPKYGGKQLDWGAYGALLTKEQIADFLQDFPMPNDCTYKLVALDPDRTYVLFACEH